MYSFPAAARGLVIGGLGFIGAACSSELTTPSDSAASASTVTEGTATAISGSLRVRCERGRGRSRASVDGNNLTPRNGTFVARIRAVGGTAASAAKRAVGDEAEFDFDSNRNDVATGATRIAATFISARSGPDVVGEILNAQGQVVASRGVECEVR